jgi:two-component system, OmpR family, KDP operon response regulator KdpE
MPLTCSRNDMNQIGSAQSPDAILIVDDDAAVRRALHITLRTIGFSILEASSGEEALALARTASFEVVLLDINMPGMNGVQTCRDLRRLLPRIGVLMLTVRDSEDDKVNALEVGADDYVTKPFHIRELAARVRASVRRTQGSEPDKNSTIRIGDIALSPARREVYKAGNAIHLMVKEFELLHYLMVHAGLPITHGRLLSSVWGPEYGGE